MLESDLRRWVICESSNRWIHAVRRFGPSMTPSPLVLDIVAAGPDEVAHALTRSSRSLTPGKPSILLWEVNSASVVDACRRLRKTHSESPATLQIVADSGLSPRERLALCEFPVHLLIQHPEQLPRMRPMVQGHFAGLSQAVD